MPVASSKICKMLASTVAETATVGDGVKSRKACARVSPLKSANVAGVGAWPSPLRNRAVMIELFALLTIVFGLSNVRRYTRWQTTAMRRMPMPSPPETRRPTPSRTGSPTDGS